MKAASTTETSFRSAVSFRRHGALISIIRILFIVDASGHAQLKGFARYNPNLSSSRLDELRDIINSTIPNPDSDVPRRMNKGSSGLRHAFAGKAETAEELLTAINKLGNQLFEAGFINQDYLVRFRGFVTGLKEKTSRVMAVVSMRDRQARRLDGASVKSEADWPQIQTELPFCGIKTLIIRFVARLKVGPDEALYTVRLMHTEFSGTHEALRKFAAENFPRAQRIERRFFKMNDTRLPGVDIRGRGELKPVIGQIKKFAASLCGESYFLTPQESRDLAEKLSQMEKAAEAITHPDSNLTGEDIVAPPPIGSAPQAKGRAITSG